MALTCRVESVDVDGQVHGLGSADALVDLLDDAFHSDRVDLACFHDFKAAVSVVFVVAGSAQSCADTGVDVAVVCEQAFLRGVEEVRSVVDAGDLAGGAAEDLRLPCIKMGIKVNY